jgi:short-chain fatty acids transporter
MKPMSFAERFERIFRLIFPSPLALALLLTLLVWLVAVFFSIEISKDVAGVGQVLTFWRNGLWNSPLLVFAVQMMLILVLGHVLALSAPVNKLIQWLIRGCTNTPRAAAIVSFFTILVSLFNWGFGLVFGAILARKVAEKAQNEGRELHYPLIGAAGYSGLMVWHGGISGSAPAKVAEAGHLKSLTNNEALAESLPDSLGYFDTVFSTMNMSASVMLLVFLPLLMLLLGQRLKPKALKLRIKAVKNSAFIPVGAEHFDTAKAFSWLFGVVILFMVAADLIGGTWTERSVFFNPNNINFLLIGLCFLFHKNLSAFGKALNQAILGASGILIQFPLYFGIMGVMSGSGLVVQLSNFFVSISTETTYPIYTFLSAGLINVFVPSGGGQWAVQGPIIVQAANDLGVSLSKSIMAFAYGDQLTNMLQPFWALPLLAITGLKARQIIPYTLLLMLAGAAIFTFCLLVF